LNHVFLRFGPLLIFTWRVVKKRLELSLLWPNSDEGTKLLRCDLSLVTLRIKDGLLDLVYFGTLR